MRKGIIAVILFLALFFLALPCSRADTIVFSIEGSPYYIQEDLIIKKGEALIAEPGAVIEMAKGAGIIIEGRLDISGYPKGSEVIFKSVGPHENYRKGFWKGIVIKSKEKNRINCAVIQHSNIGIEALKGSSVDITRNIITQNKTGIRAEEAEKISVAGNSFLNNFTDIEIAGRAGPITGNFFEGSLTGIALKQAYPKIEGNYFKQLHKYALVSHNARGLKLGENWWGCVDREKIGGLISSEGKGGVDFEPFLKKPPDLERQ